MNGRINNLAAQTLAELSAKGWNMQNDAFNMFTDRFAELIVRECLAVITPTEHHTGSYVDFSNGMKLSQSLIKKHFGVG